MVLLLAQHWGRLMEINNWFDFIIYTIYFFGVVIVILPTGVIFLWLTLKNLVKMRAPRYEKKHYKYFSARNRFEVCVAGVFLWLFLFGICFCQRGNLFLYPSEVMRFFQADDSVDQALALAQPPPAAKCLEGEPS